MKNNSKPILDLLKKQYLDARIALNYSTVWELLVAVILSAQCTDKRVNIVTSKLFKKYKTIQDYARATPEVFEQDIHSTGFYRNKAKHIISTASIILEKYNGIVPDTMEQLVLLPGVARKTANIILTSGYKKTVGIAVDTHVIRLSQRLGFTKEKDPVKIERDLMKLIPVNQWDTLSYMLIDHGRAVCVAQKPRCLACVLKSHCPSASLFLAGSS